MSRGRVAAGPADARRAPVGIARPADHVDSPDGPGEGVPGRGGSWGVLEWGRWCWRQVTSMRTALLLLLALAVAAVPGSLVPQRSSDPNGVTQYFDDNPELAPIVDSLQGFDVYTSVWFSSIYLLLFVSLIGCVVPRTRHHLQALRAAPPRTPSRLSRMPAHTVRTVTAADAPDGDAAAAAVESAREMLRKDGYRVVVFEGSRRSVSAERGYLRETGNLVFHTALVGVLVTVGIGGGFGYQGQRVLVEGQTFVNSLAAYDSINPGRFFREDALEPYSLTLDRLDVTYEKEGTASAGLPTDYTASVSTRRQNIPGADDATVKVNEPLSIGGTEVYLLGNGYAPRITVRDPAGDVAFSDVIPFPPQDSFLTSLGVVKVPDGLAEQVGLIGFFYPDQAKGANGAYRSEFPDVRDPMLTLNVYQGDLGLNGGVPRSVYALDTSGMTQLAGGDTGVEALELRPGETRPLPGGLGTVSFDGVSRFAAFDISHDPTKGVVLFFSICILAGLLASLFVPRRRMWVAARVGSDGSVELEYAGLARGDDPLLDAAVSGFADRHHAAVTGGPSPAGVPGFSRSADRAGS